MQAREATLLAAQHELAGRAALANAGAFLCGQAAILAVLIAAGANPVARGRGRCSWWWRRSRRSAGCRAPASLAGHAAAAAHRVLEAAEAPVPVPDPPRPAAVPAGFALRFEAVHFRWQPDRPPVFDGLTLDVPQGARVALLGPSGAGKSTLAALALKVAAPQQGRVLLGGVDIATLAAADVRPRIGWLAQATHLFDDTIRANLTARAARCGRRGAVGRARCGADRRDGARAARWPRYLGRRGRCALLRRPGATAGAGARPAVAGADPDPRRAVRRAGCGDRAGVPGHAERRRRGDAA